MPCLTALRAERATEASAEFRIGVGSAPYLADHGFQAMRVVPGSCYIEMARRLERELCGRATAALREVVFSRPIVLASDADVAIAVDVRGRGDGLLEYSFREAASGPGGVAALPEHVARLLIDRAGAAAAKSPCPIALDGIQAQPPAMDGERFYAALRRNGNEYGPSFRAVSAIWLRDRTSVARLALSGGDHAPEGPHPAALDAATQVLQSFAIGRGQTCVLRSIDAASCREGACPGTLWVVAELLDGAASEPGCLAGNVRAFDDAGEEYLALSGVRFSLLEPVEARAAEGLRFVIASNFTAEPVEEVLRFWADGFGMPAQVDFAPYDQIFQQLLDRNSAFHDNPHGFDVVLLALERWATPSLGRSRHGDGTPPHLAGEPARSLPNGLAIVELNRYETDYLYEEIFEDESYLRHGIRLPDGATVLDIGANIGLFSLFVASRCPTATVFAFEPAPAAYERLRANCGAHAPNVRAVNAGVASGPGTATLTFYEKSSVFSGFHADEAQDGAAIRAVVRNTLASRASVEGPLAEELVDQLTADRLRRTTHECRMTSVSEVIRENRLDRVDLLKVDAEKSEWEILQGIEDDDWPRIAQIVLEIHDTEGDGVQRAVELLTAKGYRCAAERQRLLEGSGLWSVYAARDASPAAEAAEPSASAAAGPLMANVQDLCRALRAFGERAAAPVLLCLCPNTPAAEADGALRAALGQATDALLAQLETLPHVHPLTWESLRRLYNVPDHYDPAGHAAGQILYTRECYAAIGTALFRSAARLRRAPYKLVALDCDNTLWKGVCGEDGPSGIEVSAPFRRLQERMVEQMNAGMLLCLCSRNNEQDVLDVFEARPEMPLKREQLVAWRINWGSKSENLQSLARQLGVALDSVVFIDDNPVDCADVLANCPGTLVLQLPRDPEALPAFLDHVWAFDRAAATPEDRGRTRMYREDAQRRSFCERSASLGEFIRGLGLQVVLRDAADDDLARVSQLTFRTNQFNSTGARRSEPEIRDFLSRDGSRCLVVRVSDRFGDYGLTGALLYAATADRYTVDALLLSCRVLGRGVEHRVLKELARRALREQKRFVDVLYRPTGRNAPVREFMTRIAGADAGSAEQGCSLAAERLAALEYDPDADAGRPAAAEESRSPHERPAWPGSAAPAALLQRIADDLHEARRIVAAIDERRLGSRTGDLNPEPTAPREERALLEIWRRVLGRPRIGREENFFDLGGTSLRAVQLIAAIKRELQRDVSIVTLFEYPTVASLAARLREGAAAGDGPAAMTHGSGALAAAERGARRRRALIQAS
jgi:FkbH-like protein/FkbM family methyltransferase